MKIDFLAGQVEVVFDHYLRGGRTAIFFDGPDDNHTEVTHWAAVPDGQVVVRDLRFLMALKDAGLVEMLDTWPEGGYLCALTAKGRRLEAGLDGRTL